MKRLREERRGIVAKDGPGTTAAAAEVSSPAPFSGGTSLSMEKSATTNDDVDSNVDTCTPSRAKLIKRIVEIKSGSSRSTRRLTLLEDPTGSLAGGNGATLWDSSLALTNFLAYHYENTDLSRKNVLELGAGVGLVGMALASMGANVVVTERDIALPLLRKNVDRNVKVTGGRVEVAELSWGGDSMQRLIEARKGVPFDIVVGSDIIFPSNSGAYVALADTYEATLKHSGEWGKDRSGAVDIWLSHEPRIPTVEDEFFRIMHERGIAVQQFDIGGLEKDTKHLLPDDIIIYKLARFDDLSAVRC